MTPEREWVDVEAFGQIVRMPADQAAEDVRDGFAERVVPQDEGSTIGIKESNDAIAISIPEHGERLIEATIGPCTVEEAENAAEIVQEALDGQAPSLDAVVCCELAPDFPPVPQDDPERSVSERRAATWRESGPASAEASRAGADVPLSAEKRCWCGATERHHRPGHPMHPFREATADELAELGEAERGPPICASCGCHCGCDPARLSATAPERERETLKILRDAAECAVIDGERTPQRFPTVPARWVLDLARKALSSPSEPSA